MKAIDINIKINENGEDIIVDINGTHGTECLNVLSFLDMIPSLVVEDTITKEDIKTKKVQIVGKQKIKKN